MSYNVEKLAKLKAVQSLASYVNTNKQNIATLVGSDTGKSVRTIANEELAAQLIPETAAESLDTLQEIAAWIQDHPNDASQMSEDISELQDLVGEIPSGSSATDVIGYVNEVASGKVDTVSGKGLSTNDYTDAEQSKLSGIAAGAQVNVLEGITYGGTTATITSKVAAIPTFTGATSSANGSVGIVPAPTSGNQDKFLKADGTWGTPTNTTYSAGTNIQITGTTISATDTTYSDATTSEHGLMSASDKSKLDNVSSGANKVEASITNGNIKIDGTETTVVTIATDTEVTEMLNGIFNPAS